MSPIFFPMNDNKDTIAALNAIDSTIVRTHPKLSESNKERTSKFLSNLCVYLENVDSVIESDTDQAQLDNINNNKIMNN